MGVPVIGIALGLATFAPVIARWLGGDAAHATATKVIEIAQKVTGAADPLEAVQQLQQNTDMATEFQKAIVQVEAEIELAILKDRQNARLRDMGLARAGRSNLRADIMVIGAASALVLCLLVLGYFGKTMSGEVIGVISTIAGMFGACLKDAYSFEFGSSRGSKEKDDTVAALMDRHNL